MTRTRVFYGHEGIIPPTGAIPRGEIEAPEPIVEAEPVVEPDLTVEPVVEPDLTLEPVVEPDADTDVADVVSIELPDASWKVGKIDEFATQWGLAFDEGMKKAAKLEAIEAWAASLPAAGDGDTLHGAE